MTSIRSRIAFFLDLSAARQNQIESEAEVHRKLPAFLQIAENLSPSRWHDTHTPTSIKLRLHPAAKMTPWRPSNQVLFPPCFIYVFDRLSQIHAPFRYLSSDDDLQLRADGGHACKTYRLVSCEEIAFPSLALTVSSCCDFSLG